jgi:hypothetical protein
LKQRRRNPMKKLLIAASAVAMIAATAPASAEFWAGADPGGVGVQVGPLGVGVGPRFGWRDRYYTDGYHAYGRGECRIVRERVETPSGRMIVRTHRICD